MTVTGAAVKQFIDVIKTATEHTCEPETAVAAIAAVRSELGKRPVSVPLQVAKVTAALRTLKSAVIETDSSTVVAWSEEEWSETLWNLLQTAVSGTLADQACSETLDSDDRWQGALAAAMQGHETEEQHKVGIWWSSRCCTVLALLTLAVASIAFAGMLPISAKSRVCIALCSLLLSVVACFWYSRGPDHWSFVTIIEEEVESISVVRASSTPTQDLSYTSRGGAISQLKKEMERLKIELERSQQVPPVPPHPNAPLIPREVGPPGVSADSKEKEQRKQLDALREFCAAPDVTRKTLSKPCVKKASVFTSWKDGDKVQLKNLGELAEYEGKCGHISSSQGGGYEVTLDEGDILCALSESMLASPLPPTLRSSAPVYAPMVAAAQVPIRAQAGKIKSILEVIEASSSISENWPQQFWSEVAASCEPLHPALKALLEGHGYIGAQTTSAPRGNELIAELKHFEVLGAPSQGTAAGLFQGLDLPDFETGQEDLLNTERWHSKLPTDFARAAPDIYRSVRTGGSSSVRDWISSFFAADQRSTQTFQQKFEQAAQIDFKIATCRTHAELMALLSTDDLLEINLRSLAAWLHFKRTGDTDAADSMLAVRAPGSMMDVAPTWLLTSAANHSTNEFKRKQRSGGKGGSGGKGTSGKDGKKGGAGGKAKADPKKNM
jgi:hypothetical protein